MQVVTEEIEKNFVAKFPDPIIDIQKLAPSGGDRQYFRINTGSQQYIATYSNNIAENKAFLYFTEHFKNAGCPVPEILAVNRDETIYFQQDLGDDSLLTVLERVGPNDPVKELYKKSLKNLARLQIQGHKGLDYAKCITSKSFGKQAILSDLLYFKYYFLDPLKLPYDKEKLGEDFETLSSYLHQADHKYFMFRDFQSRNILIKNEEPFFIDYQGGMQGALQYDVASLLWQAKANLSDIWKTELLEYYISCVENELGRDIDRDRFVSQYNGYVLIRLLQVLGAYGFRGLFERKAHFLTSIPLALRNVKAFMESGNAGIFVPELQKVLEMIVAPENIRKFEPVKATEHTPLVVHIKSFSFLKTGYPKNVSDNGGGFVFDCRGILNPGRIDQHKNQTGRDKPVQEYLSQNTRMDEFLANVFNVVDISVEDYIKRNFDILEVNFGCTGGQHRSVYAADAMARHLRNKYSVKTTVTHLEQNFES